MIRQWVSGHRSLVASAASGTVIAAVVATVAAASGGYRAQQVDLDDGSVWVVNSSDQAVGRANPQVSQLDSVVKAAGNALEVVQRGHDVLLVDAANSTMAVLDPATSTLADSIPLPPQEPQVAMTGDEVVVFERGTGRLWLAAFSDLDGFAADADPDLTLGEGAAIGVGDDGTLYAYSPQLKTLSTIDAAHGGQVTASTSVPLGDTGDTYSVTSVAGHWAVFDATTRRLAVEGRTVDLGEVSSGRDPVLQAPSVDGDRVLLADDAGLASVPLDGSAPKRLTAATTGTPATPVQSGGCVYAAWSSGIAWRQCGTADGRAQELDGVAAGAPLQFAVNGAALVLNDTRSGASWAVQDGGRRIDNWDDLLQQQNTQQTVQESDEDVPPQVDPAQQPPVAVDDSFGARPGRTSPLPVLLNDYDPNGDVLVISDVGTPDSSLGTIDLVNDGQQLQVTLTASATGSFTLPYTISDGRGGSATANVTVTVRAPGQNAPPQQVRVTKTSVASGAQVTTQVLGDWVDPDGDPMYVTGASAPGPDTVSSQPNGLVTFTDAGTGGELKDVAVDVGDGRGSGSGTLAITVKDPGQVPITPASFVVSAYAGRTVTVHPLDHVRGGTGTIKLNGVPAKSGATIAPSYADGTFTFTSTEIRTHYLDYVVTDGQQTATGQIRVEVQAPPEANSTPITVPKTVFVETQSSQSVNVAGTDIDPAGGVLVVTGVVGLPADGSIRADVIGQRDVRVTLGAPLPGGTATFGYRISNGLAEAQGVITVIEIPRPARLQPPIAVADDVTVRVGDAIDIPVLANDVQPDGATLTLEPELVAGVRAGGGLLFAAGDRLRYLAPATAGDFTATYAVAGPDGQTASAEVRIRVREEDADTDNPPVPSPIAARVLAGETVRIRIPLAGIDPDGDSVQLVGQATSPLKGSVSDVGTDYIDYRAGSYSAGTDEFTYTVVDLLGARATGSIRIGIAPREDVARNPIAVEDAVRVRPGRTVSIQALANDSDPDGSPLTITGVVANDPASGIRAVIDGDLVRVTPPAAPGDYGLVYTIENADGGTSSNFIRVSVDPAAPPARPVAADTALALSDVLDHPSVDVDVLKNVFFADGDVRTLKLSVLKGYGETAEVLANGRIRVKVQDASQTIPFAVANPDDTSVTAYAFIRVPGYRDALPQVNRKAPPLKVVSEGTLTIDIGDYVDAVGRSGVRITDPDTVRATHANGDPLVVNATTLRFTSADLYFGPASVSFEVTDGGSATDPDGRTATIVLSIDVTPRQNTPPVFTGGTIAFEPGEQKQLDLVRLTDYPYPDDTDELAYAITGAVPKGFRAQLVSGQRILITADQDAAKGSSAAIGIGVRDAVQAGTGGRIQMQIVSSTRPLARPGADTAVTKRGATTTIDVLANDQATNPFPETPLKVIDIRGIDGQSLPAGVAISPNGDATRLTVQVSQAAQPGTTTLQYEVADATGDPDRYVWGTIAISVQDVPDAPGTPQLSGIADRQLSLRWSAPGANNSPISGYTVTETGDGPARTFGCPGTTCTIPTNGNGPDHAVRVQVVAVNGVGTSAPATSDQVFSDLLPGAPTGVTVADGDARAEVDWTAPKSNGGSGASYYVVSYNGSSMTTTGTHVTLTGLTNGQTYAITVSSRSGAYNPSGSWNTAAPVSAHPYGAPVDPAATAAVSDDQGHVTVRWQASDQAASGTVRYVIGRVSGTRSAPACTPTSFPNQIAADVPAGTTPPGPSFTDPADLTDGGAYTYLVYAANDRSCVSSAAPVVSKRLPGRASAKGVVAYDGQGQYDLRLSGYSGSASGAMDKAYQVSLGGGAWTDITSANQTFVTSAASGINGIPTAVQVRACRAEDHTLCGPAGDVGTFTVVASRVTTAVCTRGQPLSVTAPTQGPGVVAVGYRVQYGRVGSDGQVVFDAEARSLRAGDTVPADAVVVRIEGSVTASEPGGSIVFTDPEPKSAQFDCGSAPPQ